MVNPTCSIKALAQKFLSTLNKMKDGVKLLPHCE